MMKKEASVADYIARLPKLQQSLLKKMRATIRKAAPKATEKMAYGIPTFHQERNLVHYAAYAHHIGFYPGSAAMQVFKKEFSKYKSAKGSVQFPLDEPLPLALVTKVVKFRVRDP